MSQEFSIPPEYRGRLINHFAENELARTAPAEIVFRDEAKLLGTYAFPASGAAQGKFYTETLAPFECAVDGAHKRTICLDADRAKPVATFIKAELENGFINITMKFTTPEAFAQATAGNAAVIGIHYQPIKWEYTGRTDIAVKRMVLKGVEIYSGAAAVKRPKRKTFEPLVDPAVTIRHVKYSMAGRPGNIAIFPERRAIQVEVVDNKPFAPEQGDNIVLSCNVRLQPLVSKRIYPAKNGEIVSDALPLGKITDICWEGQEVDDLAGRAGAKKLIARGLATIEFFDTPAGNAEFAAFMAQETRSILFSAKLRRFVRELNGQEYQLNCQNWEPLAVGIEGGTIMMPEATATITNAETPRPGLFQRALGAILPGRATA